MKKTVFFLIVLLILGFILRFYQLKEWLYFNMDEERDAFIVKRIIVNRHFTLIGGSVPGGIYIGPAWYYLSVIPLFLAKLNPVGLAAAASLLGVFSIWLIYFVAKKIFSEKVGLISAMIYCSSYLVVIYNRHYWPLTLAPVASLLGIFSLYKIIKNNYQYCYLLAISVVLGLQSDPSNITLVFLSLLSWWYFRISIKKKPVFWLLMIIILFHLPLLLFDFRHNFLNSKALIKLFSFQGQKTSTINIAGFLKITKLFPETLSRIIYTFGDHDISKQLTPCPKYENMRSEAIPVFLFVLCLILLISWLIMALKKKLNKYHTGIKLIAFQIIVTFFGINFFYLLAPSYIREYFLAGLFPSLIILLSVTLEKLAAVKNSILLVVLLVILFVLNSRAILSSGNFVGFANKVRAMQFAVSSVGEKPYYLDSLSTCFKYNGTRYLAYLTGKEPAMSFMDSHYSWLYDKPVSTARPNLGAVFVSLDKEETDEFWQKYQEYQANVITSGTFGGIEVLIVKHD